jgi:hypothetical protein
MTRILAAALLALACAAASAATLAEREQVERRSRSVGTLIESSSAARQIESSGVAAARERRDTARLVYREAVVALGRDDLAGANRLLDQAAREMMTGARLAKPEEVADAKNRRDFDARLASARALLAAQQRIAQEKGASAETRRAIDSVAQQIAEAEQLAAAGRVADARPLVDRAYLTARVSIESMRRGDTLVRSLQFASKREEFDYELDRNDTHRMLIQIVLADRRDAAAAMQAFIDRSGTLRAEADARARAGDYADAVKLLEDSTRELVRAIRAGGLYIPG